MPFVPLYYLYLLTSCTLISLKQKPYRVHFSFYIHFFTDNLSINSFKYEYWWLTRFRLIT